MEDLSSTVTVRDQVWTAISVGSILFLIGLLTLKLLKGHHRSMVDTQRIQDYANAQEANAVRSRQRAEIALRLQKCKSIDELSKIFLTESNKILGALQGFIYIYSGDEVNIMKLAGSFARCDSIPRVLVPGEGVLGQCALDREVRMIEIVEDSCWTIRSGLGNAPPAAVLIAPLTLDQSTLGVVELSFFDRPDQITCEMFKEMTAMLALNLAILNRQTPVNANSTETTP